MSVGRLDRALIRVSGSDSVSFLQNLLTQNVEALSVSRVQYAALLSPQGKVLADMMLWAADDGVIVIEVDPSRSADLLRRLAMYKMRAQVTLEDITTQHIVLVSDAAFDGAWPDPRLPALGLRKLAPMSAAGDATQDYDARRIGAGVPDLARDAASEEVFAGEALLDALNAVDFQKGCFVGQENVSRMKRRATTRKKFCPIAFEGEAPEFGAKVMAGDVELGTVRTGIAGRALALIRLDRAQEALAGGATLSVNGRATRLDPPPWLILPHRAHDV